MQQDEAEGPFHALLSPLGHEGWDPQHTTAEALKTLQEAIPPLLVHQVLESSLYHRRVHGHQVGPPAHVTIVVLHWCQVTPEDKHAQVDQFHTDTNTFLNFSFEGFFPYLNQGSKDTGRHMLKSLVILSAVS